MCNESIGKAHPSIRPQHTHTYTPQSDYAVPPELREQALGLISDAQTAGDRKEKEALLKQVYTILTHIHIYTYTQYVKPCMVMGGAAG